MASLNDGYKTYGDYGDVVIYDRDGSTAQTPVIHRAIVELVYNSTSNSFDIPSIANVPASKWSGDGQSGNGTTHRSLTIYQVGYKNQTVTSACP